MRFIAILFILIVAAACNDERGQELFNGKDLTGWDRWLGPKYNLDAKRFDSIAGPGLNNDPENVFTVVDIEGEPAIRVSGAHFGGISTHAEFENYHLTLEFKWGHAKYPPKDSAVRDSGLLYHAVGEHGADFGFWMRSQEFQIQEGDCGDYWGVAGGVFDVPVNEIEGRFVYAAEGKMVEFSEKSAAGRHAVKNPDAEKPSGEWNVVDLFCLGDTAVHMMNGKVNMILYKSRQLSGDDTVPLKRGKIQIQSEGAEVFYRRLRMEKITELPARFFQ
jgi:hypothetical protein